MRQFRTDYLDVLMFLGVMKPKEFPSRVLDTMVKLKEEGKAKAIGISTHNRKFAGELARTGVLDVLMVRYNAAHRGAETDIFPHVGMGNPGIVSYTATRWTGCLTRPKGWPGGAVADGRDDIQVCAQQSGRERCPDSARNLSQLQENLAEVSKGPLSEEEMVFMRRFGDVVHNRKEWFM